MKFEATNSYMLVVVVVVVVNFIVYVKFKLVTSKDSNLCHSVSASAP